MIAVKKYAPASGNLTVTANELGDGFTGSSWLCVDINATSVTTSASVVLPLASRSTGRIISLTTLNPSSKTVGFAVSGTDTIREGGSNKTTFTTTATRVQTAVFSDGTRWWAMVNDGNWA